MLSSIIKKYQHIIWDWNGTILNDVELTIDAINKQLQENSLTLISKKSHKDNFCFPIKDYYKKLGFDFDQISFEQLSIDFVKNYFDNFSQALLFPEVEQLLKEFKMKGMNHSILSASFQGHLEQVVDQFNLRHLFENIYGISDQYAGGKLERGLDLIEKIKNPKNEILLIGDTDHDLHVGQQLGIDVCLISEGHQSFERLKKIHSLVLEKKI